MNLISVTPSVPARLLSTLEGLLIASILEKSYEMQGGIYFQSEEDINCRDICVTTELRAMLEAADESCLLKKALKPLVDAVDLEEFCELPDDLELEDILQSLLHKNKELDAFEVVGIYGGECHTGAWFSFVTATGWTSSNSDQWLQGQRAASLAGAPAALQQR